MAKRAGVSTATVSRALSRPDLVSPETRRTVLQAVKHLGYTPNSAAKHLRTRRSGNFLVTVPRHLEPVLLADPPGHRGCQAQREDYAVLVGDTLREEIAREQRYALMLNSKEADGLGIFLGHRLPEQARWPAPPRRGAPPIVNGCEFNPRLGIPSVHIDNARAASDAMQPALRSSAIQRIGIITGPLVSPLSRDRLRGASTTARKRGGEPLAVVDGDFSVESGAAAARRLFEAPGPPTAIFCFNDEMAMGVTESARRTRLRVPRDLSVIGFDDIRFAKHMDPPLTTIAQPMRRSARGRCACWLISSPAGRSLRFRSLFRTRWWCDRVRPGCAADPGLSKFRHLRPPQSTNPFFPSMHGKTTREGS